MKNRFYKSVWFWLFIVATIFAVGGWSTAQNVSSKYSASKATAASFSKKSSKLAKENKAFSSLFGSSNDDDDSSSDDADDSSSSSDSGSGDLYTGSVGDSMEFKSGEKVTVSKVVDDSGAPVQDMASGEHPVAVTVTVENTKSTPLDFNAQDFDLYDGQKEIGEFNAGTYGGNVPDSIAAGMKATMVLYFGAKNNGPYSITYGDYTWAQ